MHYSYHNLTLIHRCDAQILTKRYWYQNKDAGSEEPNFSFARIYWSCLTHWNRVTYICVGNRITIGSDSGLSPGLHQVTIWTNAGILLIRTLNFSEILIKIHIFSLRKMRSNMSPVNWRPSFICLNMLNILSFYICRFHTICCILNTTFHYNSVSFSI